MSGSPEIPLLGGRTTAGVVRVGNTVRRPILRDRRLQHNLLNYLERRGFDATPQFLGIDEHGREMLSFLPGEVPDDLGNFSDAALVAAGRLLRRFHDATQEFGPCGHTAAEVICHNDWSPTNAVFRDGLPYGIIDFDTLAPGLRLWDLGYSAFTWLDLGNPDYPPDAQIRRLFVFAEAYNSARCGPAEIAIHAVARQTALTTSAQASGKTALAEWAASAAAWTVINITERLMPTGYSIAAMS